MTTMLDQFIEECRELLQQAGAALLRVERDASDDALRELFRSVHTIKGAASLFDIPPFIRAVHTGEDLLNGVREGELTLHPQMADGLFSLLDQVADWIDELESSGTLAEDAEERSAALCARFVPMLEIRAAPGAAPGEGAEDGVAEAPPNQPADRGWLGLVPPEVVSGLLAELEASSEAQLWAVDYVPDAQCFFSGGDPLLTVAGVDGMRWLRVCELAPWPALDALDPFVCNLAFHLLVAGSASELKDAFLYVEDEVSWRPVSADELCALLTASADRPPAAPTAADSAVQSPAAAPRPALDDTTRADAVVLLRAQAEMLGRPAPASSRVGRVASACRVATAVLGAVGLGHLAAPLQALVSADPSDAAGLAAHLSTLVGLVEAPPSAAPAQSPPPAAPDPSPVAGAPPATQPEDGARKTEAARAPSSRGGRELRHLKVDVDRIDALMDLTGELVVAKNALPFLAREAAQDHGCPELAKRIMEQHAVVNRIAEGFQSAVMRVRMMAVQHAFQRFPRLVRDLSRRQEKTVRLVLVGQETEADKTVVESLGESLVHLVRNAIDHGIERPEDRLAAGKPAEATLRISAEHTGESVSISVSDDGRGIDPEVVRAKAIERALIEPERAAALSDEDVFQLIFAPGFSTADSVSDVSGRGVGMDAVQTMVNRSRGSIAIESQLGQGTTVTMTLPLSMAVSRILMVEAAGQSFGLPMEVIRETLRVPRSAIQRVRGKEVLVIRDQLVPLLHLRTLLALTPATSGSDHYVVVMWIAGEPVAVVVDRLFEGMDVIVKPLAGVVGGLAPYRGTTVLGDGRVLLILNIAELVRCR